jgi:urease accessory protein
MTSYVRKNSARFGMAAIAATVLSPAAAHAHVGASTTSGLLSGFAHPLTGLDHLAAMVAVGLWAAQRGGRARWAVPMSFVSVMAVGGLLGTAGLSMPLVAPAIVASVLVLGVLVAGAVRLPLVASSFLVGLCALFHGHAHGAEMPETVAGLAYGTGFLLATGLLHGAGIGLSLLAQQVGAARWIRWAGGATAALGVYLLIG